MPEELASPAACLSLAERSNSAAELTAPHATINSGAWTRIVSSPRTTSTASTRHPEGAVCSRVAVALVQSVTFGRDNAGRTQHTSASLFACSLHTNELQVLHRMHPSSSPTLSNPSGSGEG